jgi:hypothetical protein
MKKGRAKAKKEPLPPRPRRVRGRRGAAIFDHAFFQATLPHMVESCPVAEGSQPVVTLWLGDGGQLDVAGVVKLEERYCVLAAYEGIGEDGIERTADDVGLEAIPYELILRATVRAAPKHGRLGFARFSGPRGPE